jgi:hypothetical protein
MASSSLGAAGEGTGAGVGLSVAMGVGAGLGDTVAPAGRGDAVTVVAGWLPAQAATLTRRAVAITGLQRRRHQGALTIPSLHYSNIQTLTTPL